MRLVFPYALALQPTHSKRFETRYNDVLEGSNSSPSTVSLAFNYQWDNPFGALYDGHIFV